MHESPTVTDRPVDAVMKALAAARIIPAAMSIERRLAIRAVIASALDREDEQRQSGAQAPTAEEIYIDVSTSRWLRDSLASAVTRDPVDAANDAEILARALKDRVDRLAAYLTRGDV